MRSRKSRFHPRALYISAMRWFFPRFYREWAWTYDVIAWLVSRGLWYRWASAALPYLRGRVLELGCGTGHLQQQLALRAPGQAVGLDISLHMLMLTQRRLGCADWMPPLLCGVAQALPFQSGSFDSLLITFPAEEYIFLPSTAGEIRRVLAPQGRVVIIDAPSFTGDDWFARLVNPMLRSNLYVALHKAPPPTVRLTALEREGFHFTIDWVPVGPSQIAVIVGRRSP